MKYPLVAIGWEYDDETQKITGTFRDLAPADDPDPISYQAQYDIKVELSGTPIVSPLNVSEPGE